MTDTTPTPAVWSDGDPLMEAMAAAVYEQCDRHPEVAVTIDDPRTIAAVAATVARQVLGTPTTEPAPDLVAAYASCPGYEMSPSPCRCPCYGCKHHCSAHQPASAPAAPADRATVLRERADFLDGCLRDAADPSSDPRYWTAIHDVAMGLRRLADEAEYVAAPCSPGGCEPGGEPCTTHERLMAHAEGDHELCEPGCGASHLADEAQPTETEAPSTLSALMATIQELHALQQPLVDGLRFIREDMDRANKSGDEWATEWMGQVWLELPLHVRAAGGDTDAAQELADETRRTEPTTTATEEPREPHPTEADMAHALNLLNELPATAATEEPQP
ncbi:hypothetical protein K388_05017 [Streptomyces sp. KhCrAH-43]|uniref:hypothetical protein n=1 Tax=unclassified Streptomyces TaxID=2593676 RepID=UPI00048C71C6|nr:MULTISPECIES: hypothetical protein [unclassified Streptomyces]MYX67289.1 hypothetical protein [Streptomyces sp. SID8373]RAJ54883.1 hypothetical protein K388_05017 [Streptomyces sp. KhCrAH-43]